MKHCADDDDDVVGSVEIHRNLHVHVPPVHVGWHMDELDESPEEVGVMALAPRRIVPLQVPWNHS